MTADQPPESDSGQWSDPPSIPDEAEPGWPWSFILLVVAGALYLVFRFVEFGIALFD